MKKLALVLGIILTIVLAFYFFYLANGENITIITYHHLMEEGEFDVKTQGNLIVSPKRFEEQLKALKKAGYNCIFISNLKDYHEKKASLPKKPLLITFDDGYSSNYDLAYPILKKIDMKATIFVIGNSIRNEKNPALGYKSFMTWQQAKEMQDSGIIDIQSHTYNLHNTLKEGEFIPAMTNRLMVNGVKESNKEYEKRIERDLKLSKHEIEKYVGNKVIALSFPFGSYNGQCCKIAKDIGMDYQFSTSQGKNKLIFKYDVYNRITMKDEYTGEDVLNLVESL